MKILAIGNSFSQDTTRYLADIAKANGENIEVASLYIGGCSLEKHFRNYHTDKKDYELIFNGQNTGFFVSIKEALLSRSWDVVTLQQQSLQSADYMTFSPYIEFLAQQIRELCPKSMIYLHESWGYENGSVKLDKTDYQNHAQMFRAIEKSYKRASEDIAAKGIIRFGMLICKLHDSLGIKVHRDGFHLSYGFGRFAAGLLWYKTLTGKMPRNLPSECLDEPIEKADIEKALEIIYSL